MRENLKRPLISALASGTAMFFVAALTWSTPHGDGADHNPQRIIDHMTEKLDLTDEQQAEVETLLGAAVEEAATDRQRLHTLKEQLRAQRASFDVDAAREAADEIGAVTSRLVFSMASTEAAIYQLLDDEQRLKMTAMDEKREQRRSKGRDRLH